MTLREHLRAIAYGEQLAHEDELIDLFQQHAVAALAILDEARCVMDYSDGEDMSELSGSERIVPDPAPPTRNTNPGA